VQKDPDCYLLKENKNSYPFDLWRSFKIWREFQKGFRALRCINHCITFFGSARFGEDDPYYKMARETAFELGKAGFSIMTGGGPGIMEAANRGRKTLALYPSDAISNCRMNKSPTPIPTSTYSLIIFLSARSCCSNIPAPLSFCLAVSGQWTRYLKRQP